MVGTNTYTGTALAGEGPFRFQNTNTTNGNMSSFSNYDGNGNLNSQVNFININHSGTGAIAFTTRNGGSYPEAMRIGSAGTLFIGATSSPNGTQRLVLAANGGDGIEPMLINELRTGNSNENAIRFYRNGSQVGTITNNASSISYSTSSDYRLKENIAPMTGALAKVAQLKPCTYTWKTDGSAGQGFIAHELQEIVPDAVSGEKDAVNQDGSIKPQQIDTSFLVATLTAAIQELNAKVEAQAAEIQALKGA